MTIRDTFRDLPVAELEQMLIMRAVAKPLSAPMRAVLMKTLGITRPPESPEAGRPYFDGMREQ